MKYFCGRPVSSHALSSTFSCLVGSCVRREKELKKKKNETHQKHKHSMKMHTQHYKEMILKIKCLHLERVFCTSPRYLRWGSSQPCLSGRPRGGAFLSVAHPQPRCTWKPHGSAYFFSRGQSRASFSFCRGEAWAAIALCSWRDLQLKLLSTAHPWDSLQPPGRAKQPEHTWEGKDPENSVCACGMASDYDQFLGFGSEVQRKAGRWAGSSILDHNFCAGTGATWGLPLHRCIGWGEEERKVTGRFWHFEITDSLHEALVLFNMKSVTSGPVFQGEI